MTQMLLKNKIAKSLDEMDLDQLKTAYLLLKELSEQAKLKLVPLNKSVVDRKIEIGLTQLHNGEGTDFGAFLNEMKAKYGEAK